ncbi:MAG: methyltransferase domain-containing protein, partial [Chloroflexi bacterium]|nr:methyltransferase domain-containing protein [Chloroflexota bacterium]
MLRWRPFRALIDGQARLSRAFDALLPPLFRVDGMQDFIDSFAPKYIRPGSKVYDVGGGKRPYLSPAQKAGLGIFTVGLDVDRRELERAPAGAYDEVIARDIAGFVGRGDADLVICLAVLEHVRDVEAALGAVSSILRPGGRAIAFVPSRNALYARLNRLLPESLKVKLLAILRDERCDAEGFRAY